MKPNQSTINSNVYETMNPPTNKELIILILILVILAGINIILFRLL
jgi:hypothetical protein